jgi:hypothetical protein
MKIVIHFRFKTSVTSCKISNTSLRYELLLRPKYDASETQVNTMFTMFIFNTLSLHFTS